MLLWHCIWGARHGQEAARDARRLGSSVRQGQHAPVALAVACALAVLREGAETVLFVIGMTGSDAAGGLAASLAGVLLGLSIGVAVGALIYFGLSRVPPQRLFGVTQALIVVLTAAIASQLARALAQAGLVQSGATPLWDSSAWLAPDSAPGALLHALAGYDPQPTALQLIFYVGTLLVIVAAQRRTSPQRTTTAAA
jgi:high-affinity iron transporter